MSEAVLEIGGVPVDEEELDIVRGEFEKSEHSSSMDFNTFALKWFTGCQPSCASAPEAQNEEPSVQIAGVAPKAAEISLGDPVSDGKTEAVSMAVAAAVSEDEPEPEDEPVATADFDPASFTSVPFLEPDEVWDSSENGDVSVLESAFPSPPVGDHCVTAREVDKLIERIHGTGFDSQVHFAAPAQTSVSTPSFIERLRDHEAATSASSCAPSAEDVATSLKTAFEILAAPQPATVLANKVCHSDETLTTFVTELRATVSGMAAGTTSGSRAEALGERAPYLDADAVAIMEGLPEDDHDRTLFVESATDVADAVTYATQCATLRESINSMYSSSSSSGVRLSGLTDRFISKMDRAWGAFMKSILSEAAKPYRPSDVFTRTFLNFNPIITKLMSVSSKTAVGELTTLFHALGAMSTAMIRSSAIELRQRQGASDFKAYLEAELTEVIQISRPSVQPTPVGISETLLTEFTLAGKVRKGLTIIVNHAKKMTSVADLQRVAFDETYMFINPFIARRTKNPVGHKDRTMDDAALFASGAAGVIIMRRLYTFASDIQGLEQIRDSYLTKLNVVTLQVFGGKTV